MLTTISDTDESRLTDLNTQHEGITKASVCLAHI